MWRLAILILLVSSACWAQGRIVPGPRARTVGAEYPRVDGSGAGCRFACRRSRCHKVRLNFWSGRKYDMVKRPTGSGP